MVISELFIYPHYIRRLPAGHVTTVLEKIAHLLKFFLKITFDMATVFKLN